MSNPELTLADIRRARERCEDLILDAIVKFQSKVGCSVIEVTLATSEHFRVGDKKPIRSIDKCNISINLY